MSLANRIDPELAGARLGLVKALGPDFVAQTDAATRRAKLNAFVGQSGAPASALPQVQREEGFAPGMNGAPPVRVMIYRPAGMDNPASGILYYHGGGFTVGSVDEEDNIVAQFAQDVGCAVISVDYRLAPETRHPGPVEDCYAALQWVAANAAAIGVDSERLAVMGASAGGALAANVALMARDHGGPAIAYQMLIYPMLDDRMTTRSNVELDGVGIWNASASRNAWEALFIGSESGLSISAEAQVARYAKVADNARYASASRIANLAGLPPAYIETCELEVLLDENLDYARRLIAAGVSTELHVRPGAYHAFDRFAPEAAISRSSLKARAAALRRALNVP